MTNNNQTEMLKNCPFCKSAPEYLSYAELIEVLPPDAMCVGERCPINGVVMSVEQWNAQSDPRDEVIKILRESLKEAIAYAGGGSGIKTCIGSEGWFHVDKAQQAITRAEQLLNKGDR